METEKFQMAKIVEEEDLQTCRRVLAHINKNLDSKLQLPEYSKILSLVECIYLRKKKRANQEATKELNEIMYSSGTCRKRRRSAIRYQNELDGKSLPMLEEPSSLLSPKISKLPISCHICKETFHQIHHHYYSLCPSCAEFNFVQRHVTSDLSGKISLVTGGRVKIGFEICKKLLRCGSEVILTTRFPEDCLRRYKIEKDFEIWKDRLTIVYLDLLNYNQVLEFVNWLNSSLKKLDILILNAAQTVSREKLFYANVLQDYDINNHLIKCETESRSAIYSRNALRFNSIETQQPTNCLPFNHNNNNMICYNNEDNNNNDKHKFELDKLDTSHLELDEDHQFKEYRENNSWTEKLDNFNQKDFLSLLVINLFSPTCLVQMLTPLLKRNPEENGNKFSFVVLVSAVEGIFKINTKSYCHPHTNAGKAGLNMITRTSGADYRNRFNILINSVDTGFITVETINKKGFVPPLDNMDGMARVLHPVFEWFNKKNLLYGKMLKNFKSVDF